MLFKLRIDRLFAITGLLIFFAGLFFFYSDLFEINVHDTYFVISQVHIAAGLALFFLLIALIYFLLIKSGRRILKGLAIVHFLMTLITLLLLIFPPLLLSDSSRYYTQQPFPEPAYDINTFLAIVGCGFMLAQLAFLIVIIWALTKRKTL